MTERYVVVILSYGRPDNVTTLATLQKYGYTGDVLIVVDDEDKTLPEYRERYGDIVCTFSKREEAVRTDRGDNFPELDTVLFARNATPDIVRERGYRYFIVLDDDYREFKYKYDSNYMPWTKVVNPRIDLDGLFATMLDWYVVTPQLTVLSIAQGGDFIGGVQDRGVWSKRKAMNLFMCDTERPYVFQGRLNDDVNTYTEPQRRGAVCALTTMHVALEQQPTQQQPGGLTEMYLRTGTYTKSMYSVMYCPSAVRLDAMGRVDMRIHHRVNYKACAPKIVSEQWRKTADMGKG